jgi:hypothetical protein
LCLFFNKIRIKAEQDLPGTEGRREKIGEEGRRVGGEVTQTMYARVNK